ncbi:mycofactocin-coupled SDR family oxidoreductase [Streptomyces sp. NPDC058001]|uniref:mycofactocin-coupled SDR family oxidoreductase n=1 Tax=Streptomyces sp. NPDC058001 TaxID=3346300 RepID=UPI0036E9B5CC
MTGRLTGKVAMITGAARGQGRAHAVAMAREGADIIATDICAPIDGVRYDLATEDDLKETAHLVETAGRRCVSVVADSRDSRLIRDAADQGAAELGGIDIGVVNHGVVMAGSWDTITDEEFDTVIETNLSSVWRSARAIIPHLVTRGGGSLLLTASAAGLRPFSGIPSYVTAKHGVVGLAKALAVELGPRWIRVNALCPGNVSTPMFHNPYIHDMYAGHPGGTKEEAVFPSQAAQLLPVPWFGPEAVAEAAVYLASDDGRFVTGTAFSIDAGMTNQPPGVPALASTRIAELQARIEQG